MNYTFELDIGSLANPSSGGGYISVNPITTNNGLVKYRDDDYFAVVRKKLSAQLTFKGDEYAALRNLESSGTASIGLKIYYKGYIRFEGSLLLTGIWDENRFVCALDTEPVDSYSELNKNKDYKINTIAYNNNSLRLEYESILIEVTLPCYQGSRAEAEFYYDPNSQVSEDPLTANSDWQYYEDNGEIDCGGGYRQFKYLSTYLEFAYPGYGQSVLNPNIYLKKATAPQTVFFTLDRASKFFDVLEGGLNEADSNILISELTYSDYINNATNKINNLFMMDKSDAKRNDSSDFAAYEYIQLDRLLQLYKDWFALSYKIDDSKNFYLVREGVLTEADYDDYPAHDLTDYQGKNLTNNQKEYTIESAKKPSKETWLFEDQNSLYFDKSELSYDTYLDNKSEFSYLDFNNNIDIVRTDPDEVSDSGFTAFACNVSNVILDSLSLTGSTIINGVVSAQSLVYYQLRDNRPFKDGELDGVPISLIKGRDRDIVYDNIPVDDIDAIDFDYYIKTSLGLSEAREFEISFDYDFATLKHIL